MGERSAAILVVDDDRSTLRTIVRLLQRSGYECETASSAEEAREKLSSQSFGLVLSDVKMPGDSGIDLLEDIAAKTPEIATVMVTGIDDRDLAERALAIGAYGYVIKPFEPNEILIGVSNALRRRDLEFENRSHRERLEQQVQERTSHLWTALQDLEKAQADVRRSHEKTIEKLAMAAEYRATESSDHVERMSHYCELLATKIDFDKERRHLVRTASLLHDVGNVGIPDAILRKPGKLDPEQFEIVKTHAEMGSRILRDDSSPLLELAATIALTHHEWFDGSGYPNGMSGGDIPLEGRIAAVADVFDALTSNRAYRLAYPLGAAVDMMVGERGTHFDPEVLDVFLDSLNEIVAIREAAAVP